MDLAVFGLIAQKALLDEIFLKLFVHALEELDLLLQGNVEGIDLAGGFEADILENIPGGEGDWALKAFGGFLGGSQGPLEGGVQVAKRGGGGEAPGAVRENSDAKAELGVLLAASQFALQKEKRLGFVVIMETNIGVIGAGLFQSRELIAQKGKVNAVHRSL